MNLAITADLHLPITPLPRIVELARQVAHSRPDAFVVAGDVGESLPDWQRCLSTLKSLVEGPLLVLAGNHDLWTRGVWPSRRLFEELLPQETAKLGGTWLEGEAFVQDGVAVAGSIAWYDYSAIDGPYQREPPEIIARRKREYNHDAVAIDWPWTDPEFAALVGRKLLATLGRPEADPAVRQVVVVTHVPLLECQMCRKPHDRDWGFSNAYFGNLTLGRQVVERAKVSHIISGHTHVGREGGLNLGPRRVEARVLASEYGRPAWLKLAVEP